MERKARRAVPERDRGHRLHFWINPTIKTTDRVGAGAKGDTPPSQADLEEAGA